jgi:hypothetical protein
MKPKFYKTPVHYFKVYSETYCICVANMADNYEIGIKHASLPLKTNAVESTREEFEEIFNKVQIEINKIYESNN